MLEDNRERWRMAEVDEDEVHRLSSALGLKPLLSKVLLSRRIGDGDIDEIKHFINPPKSLITDFSQVTAKDELSKAVDRLKAAIEGDETIVVNGDPDADGITGATILVSAFRTLGAKAIYDFPTRSKEGHGLQPRIIDWAIENGSKLVVTTDCGSNDIPAAEYAKSHGVDVIICDHHILGRRLPDVCAMVNPNMVSGKTPFKKLSGAGVSFKLVLALFDHMGEKLDADYQSYLLACVALGTISDRMSFLEPMNRILVMKGIDGINDTDMEGLKALKDISAQGFYDLRPRDISRTLVPRLNAPGRIGDREEGIPDARIVVELLLLGMGQKNAKKASRVVEKFSEVYELEADIKRSSHVIQEAAIVDDVNEKRKYITSKIEDEIEDLIEDQVDPERDKIIIVQGHNWNPGVIGIDTDRLRERFMRPAIILTEYSDSDFIRGSVRSIPTIDIYQVINRVGEAFVEEHDRLLYQTEVQTDEGPKRVNAFGGHSQACGFTLHRDDVPTFIQKVREEVNLLPATEFEFLYDIIDTLTFKQLSPSMVDMLDQLMPYGQAFDFPIFDLKRCHISRARAFGNRYQTARTPHVDFVIMDPRNAGRRLNAVGFGLWEKYASLKANSTPDAEFDLIFTLEKNRRQRRKGKPKEEFRLNVLDIRRS